MSKLPYWAVYPGDWFKDNAVKSLSCEETGAYFQILLICFESSRRGFLELHGEPFPMKDLAGFLKISEKKLKKIVEKLQRIGALRVEEKSSILYNKRMVEDEIKRETFAKNGRKGGRPKKEKKPNQNQNETKTKPNLNPSPENENEDESEKGLGLNKNDTESEKSGGDDPRGDDDPPVEFTIYDLDVAKNFRRGLTKWKPGITLDGSVEEWAEKISRIRRCRKQELSQIVALWDFARTEKFWKGIILDPEALDRNWDKLEIRRDEESKPKETHAERVRREFLEGE